MKTLAELRAQRATIIAAMAALSALTIMTPEQTADFDAKDREVAGVDAQITRLERTHALQATLETVPAVPRPAAPKAVTRPGLVMGVENPGFASLGELVAMARFEPHDSRVRALMSTGVGSGGGIPIPDEFNPLLREVTPQESIFRSRATVIPSGESPDADLVLPALNQGTTKNMYGGVEVAWTAEGGTKADTTPSLREARWTPHEVSASTVVTDKLLRNWKAAGPFLDKLLRRALLAAEDVAFLNGNGVAKPLGALKSGCLLTVNRATANTVKYADLVGMEKVLLEDMPAVWVVNPRVIEKLRLMEDTEGHLIWQDNARDGGVPTLFGRQVIKNFRSPAVGTKGDVLLAVMEHYYIKDGAPLSVASSEHVHFVNNKTVIKAFMTVGGSPWLDGPVKQEDGQSYSPFVALDVPA